MVAILIWAAVAAVFSFMMGWETAIHFRKSGDPEEEDRIPDAICDDCYKEVYALRYVEGDISFGEDLTVHGYVICHECLARRKVKIGVSEPT